MNEILQGDCLTQLKKLPDESIDCIVTDPPYGYSFMGKDWDKVVVGVDTWKEALRVLKPGGFAFIMSAPRQDVLSHMIVNLTDAGFNTGFTSIYWTYASGFPKASNIGKMVDKRLGVDRKVKGYREPIGREGRKTSGKSKFNVKGWETKPKVPITEAETPQAKSLNGSYGGYQPKPAVEVILVAMKPLTEKTYVDQAMKNRKGITWLDDCRVPYESEGDKEKGKVHNAGSSESGSLNWNTEKKKESGKEYKTQQGRFPANLLVSDDVLNDGRVTKSRASGYNFAESKNDNPTHITKNIKSGVHFNDSGSFSRYFDLDKWYKKLLKDIK